MRNEISFLVEDERIAKEEDFLAPIDVHLYFEMIRKIKETEGWIFSGERIEEMARQHNIEWERAKNAILRLINKQYLYKHDFGASPNSVNVNLMRESLPRMEIYREVHEISSEELKGLEEKNY